VRHNNLNPWKDEVFGCLFSTIDALRWACAVARLAKIRSHCKVRLVAKPAPRLEVFFRTRPEGYLTPKQWLDDLTSGFEFELAWLLATEKRKAGVLVPPAEV
jgi:hypothetical protein